MSRPKASNSTRASACRSSARGAARATSRHATMPPHGRHVREEAAHTTGMASATAAGSGRGAAQAAATLAMASPDARELRFGACYFGIDSIVRSTG